ncbi:coil containing protein [Vibrio phage 1.060.A._10N.261.48.B5]|nr:coil containing protein [Vibrio phage 1.060.A._10N.261.48.B5]
MAAYIIEDSLSKPKLRVDIARPIDALHLYPSHMWNNLVIIGEAGIESVKHGFCDPEDHQIIANSEQMHRQQDCAVYVREGVQGAVAVWVQWAAVAVSVAASIYSFVAAKNIKTPDNINRTSESANNRIQKPTNDARLGQRVEYICGQLRSYPAKMANEYIVIENNEQVEYGYYCIGEGEYEISDVRDGNTPGDAMAGWALNAYRPYETPMNGGSPYYTIGGTINEPIRTAFQSDESVRDEIDPPNDLSVDTEYSLSASGTVGLVTATNLPEGHSLTDVFSIGDDLLMVDAFATGVIGTKTIYNRVNSDVGVTYNPKDINQNEKTDISKDGGLTIQYQVTDVGIDFIEVIIPYSSGTIYDAWQRMQGRTLNNAVGKFSTSYDEYFSDYVIDYYKYMKNPSGAANYEEIQYSDVTPSGKVVKLYAGTLGPFAGQRGISTIQYNLLSDGLYKDAGGNATSDLTITGTITVRELDDAGIPTGIGITSPWSVPSNQSNRRKQTGDTFYVTHPYDNYQVEFNRDTPRDFDFNGAVYDVVELTELYFIRNEPNGAEYGNKTTVQTRRKQSAFSVGTAQRINMLAERQYNDGAGRFKSRYFDDAVYFAAINERFGRRSQVQADKLRSHLRDIRDELVAYFGSEEVAYFDFTFDSQDLTFEEFINQVAKSVFCEAYQVGSDIRFFPDILQEFDAMIFSHANKTIGKQSMKVSFTDLQDKNYDCVEIKWRNPEKMDAQQSIFIPSQGTNPKVIELVGIRNEKKAEMHAWREWYRIKYQRYSYECGVGIEATHLVPSRRIGIVNNIAGTSMDGYVSAWDGGVRIRTSQEVNVMEHNDYVAVLSTPLGGTQSFNVTQGVDLNELVLDVAPSFYINTNLKENFSYFRVARDADLNADSYAVRSVSLNGAEISITAVNYAEEVFQKDNLMQ